MVNMENIEFRRTLEHKYRVRSWEGQKESGRKAVKMLCDALRSPMVSFAVLRRVGVTFTWRQKFLIKFFLWLNKPGWAQRLMLYFMK